MNTRDAQCRFLLFRLKVRLLKRKQPWMKLSPSAVHIVTLGSYLVFFLLYHTNAFAEYTVDDTCSPTYTTIVGVAGTTALNQTDDAESNVTMPFSFLFFDTSSTNVRVGANGAVLFGVTTGNLDYNNDPIPDPDDPDIGGGTAILPFWDDLNPSNGDDVYYLTRGTAPNREFVVQWNNIPHYSNTGSVTIQLILHEGSDNITFLYPDVDFGTTSYNNGQSATIGLQENTTSAMQYSYNTASVTSGSAICYNYNKDFGDAPLSYGDASHGYDADLYLGAASDTPDDDAASHYSADARGDNTNGTDDENGVAFRSPGGTNDSIYADVDVNNSTGSNVTVCGWLDIPAGGAVDGSFDAGDQICQTTSGGTVTMQWTGLPSDQEYTTFARFRVCSTAAECNTPTSYASNGEVEDYQVVFDFSPTAVTIGRVELKVVHVAELLAALNIDLKSDQELLKLLQVWDPEASESLPQDDHESIVGALRNYLDPDEDSQVAVLYWDTLEERGTIGFYVERKNTEMSWTRVNADMLPGLINAPMGGEYQLADPGVTKGSYQYRLIEQEARGTTRTYGPFTVTLP